MWDGHRTDGRPTIRSRYAYRVIYEAATGEPLNPSTVLHHTCGHPECINPWHLEPLTQSEHMKEHGRGGDWGQAAKTHCARGHEYNPENTYIYMRTRDGETVRERHCRECTRINKRAYRQRSKLTTDN